MPTDRSTAELKSRKDAPRPVGTDPAPTVRAFREGDAPAWDAFVHAHPRATFFHQSGWSRILAETFHYPCRSLLAERAGRIVGVLPLFRCSGLRGRASLYSLPHTVYGGPVGEDAAVESALLEGARAIGREEKAPRIELRNRHASTLSLPALDGFVTFEKELPTDPALCYKSLPKKSREAINQGRKRHKLEADFSSDLDAFYDLLAASYKNLGTPVFPKAFFARILREFPGDASILFVRHGERAIASVLSVVFRGTMMPLYSGEARDVSNLKGNNFKYLSLMERAVELGCTRFDFGRSRLSNEGVVRFKTNQGFEPSPLPYQMDGATGDPGAADSDPNRGFYAHARRWWRRLPDGVARTVGPRLVRYFP